MHTGETPFNDKNAVDIVLCLLSHMLGLGHTVYLDSFFIRVELHEHLALMNIDLVSTT